MGVLAPGSAYTKASNQPHIEVIRNFLVHMSGVGSKFLKYFGLFSGIWGSIILLCHLSQLSDHSHLSLINYLNYLSHLSISVILVNLVISVI